MNAGCAETPRSKTGGKHCAEIRVRVAPQSGNLPGPPPNAPPNAGPPPPKNMLKRSSGLSSPSNEPPPNGLVANPGDDPDDMPPNLDSGSPPLRSYIARFCGSVPFKFVKSPSINERDQYSPERI
jgi:hypothetical protein